MLSEDTRIVACTESPNRTGSLATWPYSSGIRRARARTSSLGQHWPPHGGARTIPWRIGESTGCGQRPAGTVPVAAVGSFVRLGVCGRAWPSASATAVGEGRRASKSKPPLRVASDRSATSHRAQSPVAKRNWL